MWRRFLVLVIGFLVAFAGLSLAAELKVKGDVRIRAVSKNDYDFNADADDWANKKDSAWIEERVRLKPEIKIDEGVWLKSRISLTSGSYYDFDGTNNPNTSLEMDYAYLQITKQNLTFVVGRQLANWGNKFVVWSAPKDRVKVVYKLQNNVKVVFLYDKAVEKYQNFGQHDKDNVGIAFVYPGKPFKVGLLLVGQRDEAADENNFILGSFFFKGKVMEKIAVKGEIATKKDAGYGLFVEGAYPVNENLTVAAHIAYASGDKNKFEASKFYNPCLLLGTDQVTALGNFYAAADQSSYLFVVGGIYKVNEKLSVKAGAGYAQFNGEGVGGADAKLTEVDVTASYAVAKGVSLNFDFVIGLPTDKTANDDMLMGTALRLEAKF